MIRRLRPLIALFAVLLLVGCGGMQSKAKLDMVAEYGNAVRWSDWDTAYKFVDPAERIRSPMDEAQIDKLKDVKVSGYEVRTHAVQPDGSIDQTVDIHFIDESTQREKSMRDHQHWRLDADGEHWWLTTGLPEF